MAKMQTPVDDTLLCAFADGELDADTTREIEALAAQDWAVRHRIEVFRQSRDLLREALSDSKFTDVPARLKRSAERAVVRPKGRCVSSLALAAAAVLMLGIGIGAAVTRVIEHGTILPKSAVAGIMHDVADYHPVYARETEHLVEVPASRRAHIEQWLGDRVGLALKVPDLGAHGLRFEGGRLVALHDHVLAQLMYTGPNDQRIALCVTKLHREASDRSESAVENGLKVHGISKGKHVFVIVGPAEEPVIDRLANDLPALLTAS